MISGFGPGPIAVGLEHSRGPLVSMLLQFENFVVYPVPPQTVAKWRQTFYEQKRAQGKDHHGAVRALAFKWIRILHRCWQDSKPYEESRYLEALERRGSPPASCLPATVESL